MFTARDNKLWKAYCRKLLELGFSDIASLPTTEQSQEYLWDAKYGTTPVIIEYNLWSRMAPGWVSVSYVTEHSVRLMFKLSSSLADKTDRLGVPVVAKCQGKEIRAYTHEGITVQTFLLR